MNKSMACSYPGCSTGLGFAIACPHGQWCAAHIVAHQESDNDCRILIAEAVRLWTVKISIPLVAALKSFPMQSPFEGLPLDEVEREAFPVHLVHLEMVRAGIEGYQEFRQILERIRTSLEDHLNSILTTTRERFEGEEMPFGLDDEGVLEWLEQRMQSRKAALPEH